jgi:hypothetical protein
MMMRSPGHALRCIITHNRGDDEEIDKAEAALNKAIAEAVIAHQAKKHARGLEYTSEELAAAQTSLQIISTSAINRSTSKIGRESDRFAAL